MGVSLIDGHDGDEFKQTLRRVLSQYPMTEPEMPTMMATTQIAKYVGQLQAWGREGWSAFNALQALQQVEAPRRPACFGKFQRSSAYRMCRDCASLEDCSYKGMR